MRVQTFVRESVQKLSDDHRFVRLAAFGTMSHSLILLSMTLYYVNTVLQHYNKGLETNAVMSYILNFFQNPMMIGTTIALLFVLLIGYAILYPIGQAAVIYYCKDDLHHGRPALKKGLGKFFVLFEFGAVRGLGMNLLSFLFISSRLYVNELTSLTFIRVMMVIWLLIILAMDVLFAYAEIVIVAENLNVRDGIKRSTSLSLNHLWITLQSVFLRLILFLRFAINTIIVLGIPTGILRVAYWFGALQTVGLDWIVGITVVLLMLATAYINGIIEGFFIRYRREVYESITDAKEL